VFLLLRYFHISCCYLLFHLLSFLPLRHGQEQERWWLFASLSGDKRKREPTPPSEDFGDSEYSEEEFSSKSEGSPAPASPPVSSDDSDDSQGSPRRYGLTSGSSSAPGSRARMSRSTPQTRRIPPTCPRRAEAATAVTATTTKATVTAAATATRAVTAATSVAATMAVARAAARTATRPVARRHWF
jgi:hypothetical protein